MCTFIGKAKFLFWLDYPCSFLVRREHFLIWFWWCDLSWLNQLVGLYKWFLIGMCRKSGSGFGGLDMHCILCSHFLPSGSGSGSDQNVEQHRLSQPDILITVLTWHKTRSTLVSITALERERHKIWLAPCSG